MHDQFFEAADKGDFQQIEALIASGVDINAKDSNGITALMRAAWQRHEKVIQLLLCNKANPDAQDNFGWTAVMHAAKYNQTSALELILNSGANSKLKNNDGETAFDIAFFSGHAESAKILRAYHLPVQNPANIVKNPPPHL
jgi:ankyrin repeat protein